MFIQNTKSICNFVVVEHWEVKSQETHLTVVWLLGLSSASQWKESYQGTTAAIWRHQSLSTFGIFQFYYVFRLISQVNHRQQVGLKTFRKQSKMTKLHHFILITVYVEILLLASATGQNFTPPPLGTRPPLLTTPRINALPTVFSRTCPQGQSYDATRRRCVRPVSGDSIF